MRKLLRTGRELNSGCKGPNSAYRNSHVGWRRRVVSRLTSRFFANVLRKKWTMSASNISKILLNATSPLTRPARSTKVQVTE